MRVLAAGEHFGRYEAHLYLLRMGELFRVEPERPEDPPPPFTFPTGGELTVGGHGSDASGSQELERLSKSWTDAFSRACGIPMWSEPAREDA